MKYVRKTFTLPAGPQKVTEEEWQRIFGKPEPKKRPKKRRKVEEEEECCGCEGCSFDCGCRCS